MDDIEKAEIYIKTLVRVGAKLGIDKIITTFEQLKKAEKIMREEYGIEINKAFCKDNIKEPSLPALKLIDSIYLDWKAKQREKENKNESNII